MFLAARGKGWRRVALQQSAPRIDLDQFRRGGNRRCFFRAHVFRMGTLTAPPHPRVRHCPVCGIAMQASKSREDLPYFDIFQCLSCETLIHESKPQPPAGNGNTP